MKLHLLAGVGAGALLLMAGQACAAEAAAAAAANEVEEVVVYGKGESRQVQTIAVKEIEQAAPGTSPIKLVEKLPGVNFQSADAFGAYEWSTRISIRAFTQNQLGFTLDDLPLGDMSYGNFNGLHISRAIASEDLGGVELAQGAGALSTASSSNLGGALKFTSRAPSDKFGVLVALTGGSDNTFRGFVRLDSGVLPTGGKAYLSYANQKADKWKGVGQQKQEQIDFKIVQPIGDFTLTGLWDHSERRENDYQDLSIDMIKRLGYNVDNISGNWATAVKIAQVYQANPGGDCTTNAYPAPYKCVDDVYFDASGLRDDDLYSVNLSGPLGPLQVSGTLYGHTNEGQGTWFTPYVASPNYGVVGATTNNAPISVRTTEYNIERNGVILGAVWNLAAHKISFGGWYEDNDFHQARRFYGLNLAAPQRSSLDMQRGPFFTQWEYQFNTQTTQAYVEDVWTINDAFKVNFGAKTLKVRDSAYTVQGAPAIAGTITSKKDFLPQVGVTYKLSDTSELFGGYSENMRAFGAAHTGASPFAGNQASVDVLLGKTKLANGKAITLQPETSKTFEAGWRFQNGAIKGVAAVYFVKFENRLLGISTGAGIVGNPTVLQNVGGVESKGFETAGTWTLNDNWSLFGSYAYNDSTYTDDVKDPSTGAVTHAINGKTTTDAPKHLFNAEVAYDYAGFFAKLSAHYTSKRFFTYTNDQSVPSTTTLDLTAGYKFSGEGLAKGLEIQANVTNLLDKQYISTIGSNGYGYAGDNQTLLAGAPRQFFVTVRKQF